MSRENVTLTDEQIEQEVEELEASPHVKLARKENRLKYARRQRLYTLRNLQKRGQQLEREGITFEELERRTRMMRLDYDPSEDPANSDLF